MPCKLCSRPIKGRYDKIFCSLECKNDYHTKLRRHTNRASKEIDKILHRNRSILLEIMGKNLTQKKIVRQVLDKKKFNFQYCTGFFTHDSGNVIHYVYDFSWMTYPNQEVLIRRKYIRLISNKNQNFLL